MKYILYFHFYAMSCGNSICNYSITTIILIEKDSIMFYIYDLGYISWKIDKKEKEEIVDKRVYRRKYDYIKPKIEAIYHISYKDIKGFIMILDSKVEIRVLTEKRPILIQLKE